MAKGNGPIQYNELFNNDVNQKLAELGSLVNSIDADFQGLATTIKGMSGRINVSIKSNNTALRDLDAAVSKVDVSARGASDTMSEYGKELDATSKQTNNLKTQQSALDQIFDISSASVTELNARIKTLTAEYNSLGRASDADKTKLNALSSEVRKLKDEQANLSSALSKTRVALQSAEGSYNSMSARLNQLRKDLKEIPGAFNAQTGAINKANPVVKKYIAEINQLDATLKKVDATLGQHQRKVGNYSGALAGAGNQLASLAAGYLSVQAAMQVAGGAFDSALKIDSIKTALEFTFKSSDVANQKLNDIKAAAESMGLEYLSLANSYKMFTAAATAANFPLKTAEKLFYATAAAGARLKLSTDDVDGSFRAFVQMISKGNVQAEELRGQLGERLYGAFSIAARSMGKTEKELNKMLQTGQVLATDLLPRLAVELDNTFGLKQDEKIEGLQQSWNRLKNTFDFTVEDSKIGDLFKGAIDSTNNFLSSLKNLVTSSSWKEFFINLNDYATFGLFKSKSETIINGPVKSLIGGAGDIGAGGIFNQQLTKTNPLAPIVTGGGAVSGGGKTGTAKTPKNELELMKERIDKLTTALKIMALEAVKANKAFTPDPKTIELLNQLNEQLRFAEAMGRRETITQKGQTKGVTQVTGGGLSFVDDLEKLQSVDRAKLQAPLLAFSELLDAVAKADKKGQQDLTQVYSDEIQKRLQKTEEAKQAFMAAIATMQQNAQVLGEIFGEEFGNLFSELTTTLEDFVVNGQVGFEQLAQVAVASVRAINESYQQGTAIRIEQLQLEKQAQIDIAGTNKDARLNIEKEYNDKIRAEKTKQARLDKTAAVFEIAINTAVAVSKLTAQTGLLGTPLIPIIIGLGLAQIAAVLARPIPQFRHGTQSAPGGLAEVAEDGPEAIVSPKGHMRIAHKRQITFVERGSKVLTASQTKKMMEMQDIDRGVVLHGKLSASLHEHKRDEVVQTMALAFKSSRVDASEIGDAVGSRIAQMPFGITNFDERGVTKFIRKGNTTTKILNDRYSLKK